MVPDATLERQVRASGPLGVRIVEACLVLLSLVAGSTIIRSNPPVVGSKVLHPPREGTVTTSAHGHRTCSTVPFGVRGWSRNRNIRVLARQGAAMHRQGIEIDGSFADVVRQRGPRKHRVVSRTTRVVSGAARFVAGDLQDGRCVALSTACRFFHTRSASVFRSVDARCRSGALERFRRRAFPTHGGQALRKRLVMLR